jgi:hypothetical protein
VRVTLKRMDTSGAKGAAAGGGSGLGLGVLVIWIAGYLGLPISAEVGSVIGGMALSGGAAVGTYGIFGCCRRLLWGRARTA